MRNRNEGLALKRNFFFLCTREKDKRTGEEASGENSHFMVSIYEGGVEILSGCVYAHLCICMSS